MNSAKTSGQSARLTTWRAICARPCHGRVVEEGRDDGDGHHEADLRARHGLGVTQKPAHVVVQRTGVGDALGLRPCCNRSPRHRMPWNSRKEGSKCVSMAWRATSAGPYRSNYKQARHRQQALVIAPGRHSSPRFAESSVTQ